MAGVDYKKLKRQLVERIEWYAASVRSIYVDLSDELIRLAMKVEHEFNPEKPFRFELYPGISKRAERIFEEFRQRIYSVVENAKANERLQAEIDTGAIIVSAMGEDAKGNPAYKPFFPVRIPEMTRAALEKTVTPAQPPSYPPPSPPSYPPPAPPSPSLPPAGQSPLNPRRFNLSDRVWNLSGNFRDEIQRIIDEGIGEGLSADNMSRRLRQYLNEPNKLFRRVRDEHGQLHLSKAAKGYHPGSGVYRSSYKNAMRLARTEINMAYHEQAYECWQKLDFIVGFRVVLSAQHPVYDICDNLQGEYPKDFKFLGWHPQCMCHTIALIKGEDGEVKNVPENFRKWVDENADRIAVSGYKGTTPYFLSDNDKYVHLDNFKATELQKYTADSRNEYLGHDTKQWQREYFNRENGGYLTVDKERIAHSKVSKNEKAKFDKEYAMSMVFARNGYKVEMLKERSGFSSSDITINGAKADLKRVSSHNNIVKDAKKAVRKQGAEMVLFEFEKETKEIYSEIKKLSGKNIHGRYYFTGEENKIYAF
jgi:hypothetical protein